MEIRTPSKRSNVQSNFQSSLEEVDFSSTIPNLKYKRQENISPEMSPTHSQMMSHDEPAQLMMLTKIFKIDRIFLKKNEAKKKKHKDKSKWFFSKLTNEQKECFKKTMVSNYKNEYSNVYLF